MKNMLMVMVFVTILLLEVGIVNAANWDNSKSALIKGDGISKYGKIEITNAFGLGDKLISLELKNNTASCSNDCSAETEIILFKDGALIDDVRFMKSEKETSIESYQFYIQDGSNSVNDYGWIDSGLNYPNGTAILEYGISGSHLEPIWIEYKLGEEKKAGTYKIRLEGKKDNKETIDWQITSQGVLIDDWILWGATEKYEYYDLSNSNSNSALGTATWLAQTFTVGNVSTNEDFYVINVSVQVYRDDVASGVCTLGIRAVNSTAHPTGIDLANGTRDLTEWTQAAGTGALLNFTMTTPYKLLASTQYAIILRCPSIVGAGTPRWNEDTSSPSYDGGRAYKSTDSGVTQWTADDSRDRIFEVYGAPPTLQATLNSPIDNYKTINNNNVFNCSGTTGGEAISNISFWTNQTGVWALNETNTTVSISNWTTFTKNIPLGSYDWSCQVGSSSGSNFGENRTIIISSYIVNSVVWNTTTYETAGETFTLNLTVLDTPTNGILYYNGTETTATITSSGDEYIIEDTIDIPVSSNGLGNKTFYFKWDVDSTTYSSENNSQIVGQSTLALCNATYTTPYLNFTFADESDSTILNASVDLATFTYWLGSGTVTKSFIYQNTTDNFNYAFCFYPENKSIFTDLEFKYSKTSYPLRTFSYDNQVLTNVSTNKVLYLLGAADGIYSAFRTADTAGGAISGVTLQYERQIGGVWTLLGQEVTGADGIATLWLNPNYQYRITATKTGYTTAQAIISPSQSQYTITMSSGTGGTFTSSVVGLRWAVYPGSGTLNPGNHNFNATIFAYYGDLENCKLELLNANNKTVLTSATGVTNSTSCAINFDYSIVKNIKYFGRLSADTTNSSGFFIIDSDWYWLGADINNSQSWSKITSFFQDVKSISELGDGVEGEFSRLVLFFLIFTMIIGVFTFFSGVEMSNPGVSIILIWGIILFASAGNFFTYSAGTHLTGEAEVSFIAQYGLLIAYTILTTGYVLGLFRRTGE